MNITIGETHPWGNAEIAWINRASRIDYIANLRRQINNPGNTHVHRQVDATRLGPDKRADTLEILHDAYGQFNLLRTLGIQVPAVDFHIVPGPTTHPNRVKTLARVEIIEGRQLDSKTDTKLIAELDEMIDVYNQRTLPGERLIDISSTAQYLYGTLRQAKNGLSGFILADIEPIF